MQWVAEFYRLQNEWTGCYSGPPGAVHRNRAKQILELTGIPAPRILELGCGGGQIAVALAELECEVTAIDLNLQCIENATAISADLTPPPEFIQGDFFEVSPGTGYDAVCYLDGFGLGSDEDQRNLLARIRDWLKTDGLALIDVFTPWYWKRQAGREMQFGGTMRRYGFDGNDSRMLDSWWIADQPDKRISQSLKCYSPDGFSSLLAGLDLNIEQVLPGGAMDYEANTWHDRVEIEQAMSFMAVMRKGPSGSG